MKTTRRLPDLGQSIWLDSDRTRYAPDVIVIASAARVALAVEAHEELRAAGVRSRVVSMPSWDLFDELPQEYRDGVLPPAVTARLAVEQGSAPGWERYVGPRGGAIGMKAFGASAPLKALQKAYGFEPERVAGIARALVRAA